jgi:hypothetical protein
MFYNIGHWIIFLSFFTSLSLSLSPGNHRVVPVVSAFRVVAGLDEEPEGEVDVEPGVR